MMPDMQALLEKIQAPPIERIAEIEDFAEFIAAREQERSLTPRFQRGHICRGLEQSGRRRLRCPMSSAMSCSSRSPSPAKAVIGER
jgi:hypothetical protein